MNKWILIKRIKMQIRNKIVKILKKKVKVIRRVKKATKKKKMIMMMMKIYFDCRMK
jgi:hypothetical protein